MSAKENAIRLLHIIGGSILTIVGIFLLIFQLSGSKGSDLGYAPAIALFFGIAWLGVAFDKHKKAQKLAQNNPMPVKPENNPATVETEHTPPPINQG